jgi:hypothetical protein
MSQKKGTASAIGFFKKKAQASYTEDPWQKEYTMSKSISTNLKLIIKQSTNLPLKLTAASVELLAAAATLGSTLITEVVPTAKDVGKLGQSLVTVWNDSEFTSNSGKEGQ